MDQTNTSNQNGENSQDVLARRDAILGSIAWAAEQFLSASASSWPETVNQVIARVGESLGVKRIFLLKHQQVTADSVQTGLQYEWVRETAEPLKGRLELQSFSLQATGFGRWAGVLYAGGVINAFVSDLPTEERGNFISPGAISVIAVPVFVGEQWWGFIGFEDYYTETVCSALELNALKTVSVTFGAAIRRKRAEEALQAEKANVEAKAREIADIARFPAEDVSPVLRISSDGRVLYANRAAQPVLGLWQTKVGSQVPPDWRQIATDALATSRGSSVDLTVEGATYDILTVPVKEAGYVNLYGRDVTRERALAQAQTDFISMASHQLRSPLTSVRWYSERLLKKGSGLTADQAEMAEVVHKTAVQLAEIVDDLLNLSRMEQGTLAVVLVEADLTQILAEVVTELTPQYEAKLMQVSVHHTETWPKLWFDAKLVREVTINLISNAIKYTPEGGKIEIEVTKTAENMLKVAVKDSGMGIPQTEQDKVFNRFYRSPQAISAKIPGTGLGLSVAKLMVKRWGGEIGFISAEGQGSTFFYTIPIRTEPPEEHDEIGQAGVV